jgi:hypothetical protein
MLNLIFIPIFLEKFIQDAIVNFGSQFDTITISNPWYFPPLLRIGYRVSNATTIPTIDNICTNLVNRSTIPKIALYASNSDKFEMKFLVIQCHGSNMIRNIC